MPISSISQYSAISLQRLTVQTSQVNQTNTQANSAVETKAGKTAGQQGGVLTVALTQAVLQLKADSDISQLFSGEQSSGADFLSKLFAALPNPGVQNEQAAAPPPAPPRGSSEASNFLQKTLQQLIDLLENKDSDATESQDTTAISTLDQLQQSFNQLLESVGTQSANSDQNQKQLSAFLQSFSLQIQGGLQAGSLFNAQA